MVPNNPVRYVASDKLHIVGVMMVLVEQELFRIRQQQKMGLTPKERAFVEQMEEDVRVVRDRTTKLRQRLMKTTNMDWDTWTPYE